MRTCYMVITLLALATSACDKDTEFDDVAPVTAPATATPTAPLDAKDGLPTSHPPIAAGAQAQAAPPSYASPEDYGKTGPLRWSAPERWIAAKPAGSMRLAEYVIPGGTEPGELTIFYFGPSGGGGVEANITRWVDQFQGGGEPTRSEEVVNGLKVYGVDASGTFNAGMAGGNAPPKPGQRMLGAIAESPAGLFFFKLVGPADVVEASQAEWKSFVASFAPGT